METCLNPARGSLPSALCCSSFPRPQPAQPGLVQASAATPEKAAWGTAVLQRAWPCSFRPDVLVPAPWGRPTMPDGISGGMERNPEADTRELPNSTPLGVDYRPLSSKIMRFCNVLHLFTTSVFDFVI